MTSPSLRMTNRSYKGRDDVTFYIGTPSYIRNGQWRRKQFESVGQISTETIFTVPLNSSAVPPILWEPHTQGVHTKSSQSAFIFMSILLLQCSKLSTSGYHFHFRSFFSVIFLFCKMPMDILWIFSLYYQYTTLPIPPFHCLIYLFSLFQISGIKIKTWNIQVYKYNIQ